MKYLSPLRYPGGKKRLAKFVADICIKNGISGHYVEPFGGGASVALYLLINGFVKKITINDYDRGIYAFWYSILNETNEFCRKIETVEVNLLNWRKFKEINCNKKKEDLFELGFATFFLNRTNLSGIINGGMIGGIEQKGNYKLDCRFNREDLIGRIKLIAKYKKSISVKNLDALKLIKELQKRKNSNNTIYYFDPPYFVKGPSLYMNHYESKNHESLSKEISKIKKSKWIVSYDNVKEIKSLYKDYRAKEFTLSHNVYKAHVGKEILFFSDNIIIPKMNFI